MTRLNAANRRAQTIIALALGKQYPNEPYVSDMAWHAITALLDDGYVILRAESVRRAAERKRLAEARVIWESEAVEYARRWGEDAHREIRRLSDRCSFLYGEARAAGRTPEQLAAQPKDTT